MARGRIIYPAFWSDAKIVRLSPFARLFYIGMWNHAYCDQGHLDDDAFDLKLKILPADPVDADALLAELVDAGRVIREVLPGGGTYLGIPRFIEHQKADDKRYPRKCPICTATTGHGRALPGTTEHGVEGKGIEGIREGGGRPSRYCPNHPNGTTNGCYACRDAREAQAEWDKTQKNKPTPQPPRKEDLCPVHEWNRRDNCNEPH